MKITPFETEHFFARYEFNTPYQLCNSDCETVAIDDLLKLAGISMAEFGALSLGYTESQGNPNLRAAIAETYNHVHADEVVVLGTPVEGIYLAARAILNPTDEVVVLTPAYDALANLFEHIVGKARVHRWAFEANEARWTLNFDQLERLITPQTKLVVVNFPHNPTGYLPTTDDLKRLTSIIEANNLWLFCDEMYHGLVHGGTAPTPSVADLTKKAVILSGLSKTYGLPGLRTGWLIVPDKALQENIINWKFYTSICPPAPSEFLASAALQVRDALCKRNIAQIEHNIGLAEAFFSRWQPLFTWRRPQAGSTALVEFHGGSVRELAKHAAAEAGVLLHPTVTMGTDDRFMRFGLGRKGFGVALEHFEAYLNGRDDLG